MKFVVLAKWTVALFKSNNILKIIFNLWLMGMAAQIKKLIKCTWLHSYRWLAVAVIPYERLVQ